uniref:Uncharacterized protein n=1 Tax=Oryza nivara TaxID=4536 RepID=A0A0E0I8F5_ORYNI
MERNGSEITLGLYRCKESRRSSPGGEESKRRAGGQTWRRRRKLGHYPGATARLDLHWIDGNGEATSGGAPDAENNDGRNTMVVSFWDEVSCCRIEPSAIALSVVDGKKIKRIKI